MANDKKPESQSLALIPTTADEVVTIVKMFARSALIPEFFKKSANPEADLYFTISYGMDMGFSPTQSLRAINVIQGKPGLYADAMVALVLSSGKAKFFRVVESTPESATYETCRTGEKAVRRKTFSAKDAERAGLVKGAASGWGKYPQHMCEARAKSWLARDCYPDVLHGVYSSEELEELEDETSASDFVPIGEASVVATEDPVVATFRGHPLTAGDFVESVEFDRKPEPDDIDAALGFDTPPEGDPGKATLLEQIETAPTIKDLRDVAAGCADVTDGPERQALRDAYSKRMAELKG